MVEIKERDYSRFVCICLFVCLFVCMCVCMCVCVCVCVCVYTHMSVHSFSTISISLSFLILSCYNFVHIVYL